VGFRYTVQELARSFPVGGYVRNLPNGDVELVAEGAPEDVDSFLSAVSCRMARYIESNVVNEENPTGMRGFQIRH
jgi:acylphosphatase